MRKLTCNELKNLEPKTFDKDAWLSAGATWCVVCNQFVDHWIDAWGNPGPSFSARYDVGGWYCSHHDIKSD